MLPRANLNEGNNLRGPPQQFGQGEHFDNRRQDAHTGRMLSCEVNERCNWLRQLGLSASCAYNLAVHTLELPAFNEASFQQRWRWLQQRLGPSRRSEADTIVLREIRELLQRDASQTRYRRTPSPPRDLNWNYRPANSPDCNRLSLAQRAPLAVEPSSPARNLICQFPEPRMTSTPLRELEPVRHGRESRSMEPDDVYDINADPRNLQDEPQNYNGNNNYNTNNSGYWIVDQHDNNRNYVYCEDADRRGIANDVGPPQSSQYQNNNHNNNYYSEEAPHGNNNQQQQQLEQPSINLCNTYNDCLNNNNNNNNNIAQPPQDYIEQNVLNTKIRNPARMRLDRGWRKYGRKTNGNPSRTENSNSNKRKRAAEPGPGQDNQRGSKRRNVERPSQIFAIGAFEMPHMSCNNNPLPQPESQSYAVKFFQRKHSCIIRGLGAMRPHLPKRISLEMPPNYSRGVAKRFRLSLRETWMDLYRDKNYKNWNNWWTDFKWCKADIDRELEYFRGFNLRNDSFLHVKVNYDCVDSVGKVLHLAHLALNLNTTNYQSVLGTIFELMNESFLEKLCLMEMAQLQDLIRFVPNHLWVYKMRSMVYLWSRYSRLRKVASPSDSTAFKELYATQSQWNSPLFHWLAKQAYDELLIISPIEWPEHKNIYPYLK